MDAAYTACSQGGVAFLESPTGTGKTMSLICGVLQWLEDHRREVEAKQRCEDEEAMAARRKAGDPDWVVQAAAAAAGATLPGAQARRPALSLEQRRARDAARQHRAASGPVVAHVLAAGRVPTAGGGSLWPSHVAQRDRVAEPADEEAAFLLQDPVDGSPPQQGGGSPAFCGGTSSSSDGDDNDNDTRRLALQGEDTRPRHTQVIFCTRTHSQLSQFVSEFKRTGFPARLALAALASRKVLCIHDPVARLGSGPLINQACLDLQQARRQPGGMRAGAGAGTSKRARAVVAASGGGRCPFLQKRGPALEAWQDTVLTQPMDVEELASRSRAAGVCAYYGGRSLVGDADVVLAPYASVLQPEARAALGIHLPGAVLVVDEAHNLVSAVNQTCSAAVSAADLSAASGLLSGYVSRVGDRLSARNAQQLQLMQRVVLGLQAALGAAHSSAQSPATGPSSPPACMNPSDFLLQHELDDVNLFELLAWAKASKLLVKLASYTQWLGRDAHTDRGDAPGDSFGSPAGQGSRTTPRSQALASLQALVGFLGALTSRDTEGRVLMDRGAAGLSSRAGLPAPLGRATGAGGGGNSLRYIQLDAAAAFGQVLASCRAVLLASGTLSPVEGLMAQLFPGPALSPPERIPTAAATPPSSTAAHPEAQIVAWLDRAAAVASHAAGDVAASRPSPAAATNTPSPPLAPVLLYSCGHVVPPGQVAVLVAGSGPTGRALDMRAAHRASSETMDEVGRLLLNVCRVVPGGVVVFAPSFEYVAQLSERWQRTGLAAALGARKALFIEPRGAADVERTLARYSEAAEAGCAAAGGDGATASGAVLLAVVGGKLSEGINFGDDLGRCVVVLGLPYANPTDPELCARMAHLDRPGGGRLTGRQLYEGLCLNAVNQCVGRVVRHARDHAAVLLVDARYVQSSGGAAQGPVVVQPQDGSQAACMAAYQRNGAPVAKLPAWMHASVCAARQDYAFVHSRLVQFFRSMRAVPLGPV